MFCFLFLAAPFEPGFREPNPHARFRPSGVNPSRKGLGAPPLSALHE